MQRKKETGMKRTENRDTLVHHWQKFKRHLPEMAEAYDGESRAAYAPGHLDAKTKRLMAIAVAVASKCEGCMIFQTDHALEQGATPEEIMEACGVAVSLGGTMAASEVTVVMEYLAELGKI
ncbi:carboxymuconolactone decarboxylase family protein [Pseudodesulfovibrio senegalensis]|jgi:AhpD family alkylhydroperoxidase|uniref:Carboxymuconolactone decarboxylase family protein n=2 Tax=Pseudodesulfovibrio senegalensis TaxID=1721087 RepID=A0A6N6N0L4_9BACT|nr:carboxymuconolactone decarboxylase family protein [Pseudodesulfovibrio senegalensis]